MRARPVVYLVVVCLCLAPILLGQDAVRVDPKHYTVGENAQHEF
jgi:hypothetical protein